MAMLKIAHYGEPGSYSEQAALDYFKGKGKLIPFKYLSDIFDAVEKGADYGVVPIENSLEGAATQTYDALLEHRLSIVAEHIIRIKHCLLVLDGVKLKEVKVVYSNPQALGQCKRYLEHIKVDIVPFYDTAGSAKMLKEKNLRNAGAIASKRAAAVYGLKVIAKEIEMNKHNYTRFVIITKKHVKIKDRKKTSIVFKINDSPGTLFNALSCFAKNKVNLLYIQSRPIRGRPWEYSFYVDCDGDVTSRALRDTLYMLKEKSVYVKVLGSYPKASTIH
jgi:chorismate mutase / prephenate dehydratase